MLLLALLNTDEAIPYTHHNKMEAHLIHGIIQNELQNVHSGVL